ncbi:MAG: hypothetical protein F6J97_00950 [Leptolyngbya sp. SIO4C1]|nr:hypothetical protein [Leptolyngbya sp. SIO4C1]
MGRGGRRENAGKKLKWGEEASRIGVPKSIGNDLVSTLEHLWEKGVRGQELINALQSAEFRKIRKYDYPVSAGEHSTSSVGGDSLNTNYEEVDLLQTLIEEPDRTFIVPVSGDSMIGIGIYPGDWLIVEKLASHSPESINGQIVVVAVNDETMVKRYKQGDGEIILESENDEHSPIRVSESSEASVYVSGIVKNAIRRNLSKF